MQDGNAVIAAVGLAFEAKIAAGPGVTVLGRDVRGLAASVERAIAQGCRGIVSFGIAGGLAHNLKPGSFIIGSSVIDVTGERFPTCPSWAAKLLQLLPGAVHAPIAGSEGPVAHPAVKRLLHKKTGAAIVDMESHLVARIAAKHGIAFAALRVVCDPAHRALPTAALAGMRDDGTTDGFAVMRKLAARPGTLPGVMLTAVDAAAARASLQRCRKLVGAGFGLLEPAIAVQPETIPAMPVAESQPA